MSGSWRNASSALEKRPKQRSARYRDGLRPVVRTTPPRMATVNHAAGEVYNALVEGAVIDDPAARCDGPIPINPDA